MGGSPIYYKVEYTKLTMYMAKPPMILKAVYMVEVDEETGLPKQEDMMMFVQSYLTGGIPIIDAREEGILKVSTEGDR